jgi:hypothetical protein
MSRASTRLKLSMASRALIDAHPLAARARRRKRSTTIDEETSAMEDFRIKTSWRTSRKRRRIHRELGADGVLAVVDLWAYVAAERPSGDLAGLTDQDIEDEAAWDGEPGSLIAALIREKLIDGEPGARRVHDWAAHNPYVAGHEERREAARRAGLASAAARSKPTENQRPVNDPLNGVNDPLNGVNDPLNGVNDPSTTRSTPFNGPSTPSPSPSPSPDPSPFPYQQAARARAREDDSDLLTAADLEVHAQNLWGWGRYRGRTQQAALDAQPFSASEVEAAKARVDEEMAAEGRGRGNLGLLVSVIARMRADATRAPPGARQRDVRYGMAEPSTDFGPLGVQVLPP